MTHTSEHDKNPRLFTWAVAENKQPIKPAKQPLRCSESEMDLLTFATEFQRAVRAVEESSAVSVLKRVLESKELSQVNRVMHNTIQIFNNSELAAALKQVQELQQCLGQSIADELRVMTNDYRHQ